MSPEVLSQLRQIYNGIVDGRFEMASRIGARPGEEAEKTVLTHLSALAKLIPMAPEIKHLAYHVQEAIENFDLSTIDYVLDELENIPGVL